MGHCFPVWNKNNLFREWQGRLIAWFINLYSQFHHKVHLINRIIIFLLSVKFSVGVNYSSWLFVSFSAINHRVILVINTDMIQEIRCSITAWGQTEKIDSCFKAISCHSAIFHSKSALLLQDMICELCKTTDLSCFFLSLWIKLVLSC